MLFHSLTKQRQHGNVHVTMVHPTTMVAIVMPKAIHRQTCPV